MIRNIIKQSFIWIIIVGTLGFALAQIMGTQNTLLTEKTIMGIKIYIFDLHKYIANLEDAVEIDWTQFFPQTPNFPGTVNIGNMLIFILNWLLFIINVAVLAPIKLLIQPLVIIMSLLGFNVQDFNIYDIMHTILYFNIPQFSYVFIL